MDYAERVRRIALSLPEVADASNPGSLAFTVTGKGFAWSWQERIEPKKPRKPRLDVLAVRCDLEKRDILLEAAPDRFFTEPHYNGYPAILIRLDAIGDEELAAMLTTAWKRTAPPKLAKTLD